MAHMFLKKRKLKAASLTLVLLAGAAVAGEIQSINTNANFGPQEGTTRKIYDRPYTEVGAVSYGEIGWDVVKAVDPGIKVYNNVPIFSTSASTNQIIADCVMAPRTAALVGTQDKACNDGFQTHKRYKMSATGFGPIDMVFTVKNVDNVATIVDKDGNALDPNEDQDTTRNVYRMIGKLNNHTGKRMSGFKVELGRNIGGAFVPASATSNLRIALREEGDADTTNDLSDTAMAEFPGGLFYGPADDKHSWGFFSSERAGFTVDQTALKTGTVTFGSQLLNGAYEGLFGKWLPINWVPTGWFHDEDGDPGTDAKLIAWNNSTNWLTYIINTTDGSRTEAVVSSVDLATYAATPSTVWTDDGNTSTTGGTLYATWDAAQSLYVLAGGGTMTNDDMAAAISVSTTLERRAGYVKGPVEDLANLNLNYFIEVGDISSWDGYDAMSDTAEFTLRITPLEAVGASDVAPPWVSTSSGGGCSATNGKQPVDPLLPLFTALGLAGWALRRRAARRH